MIDATKLNNPEYRWDHKEELRSIMGSVSSRRSLGMKVIDYNTLRSENNKKIKLNKTRRFNLDYLMRLVDHVPDNADRSETKKGLSPADRLHFERRDKGECFVCGYTSRYDNYDTSCHLHHIIPNGDTADLNIVTLCVHCHQVVHHLLYLTGKWRYARPL